MHIIELKLAKKSINISDRQTRKHPNPGYANVGTLMLSRNGYNFPSYQRGSGHVPYM